MSVASNITDNKKCSWNDISDSEDDFEDLDEIKKRLLDRQQKRKDKIVPVPNISKSNENYKSSKNQSNYKLNKSRNSGKYISKNYGNHQYHSATYSGNPDPSKKTSNLSIIKTRNDIFFENQFVLHKFDKIPLVALKTPNILYKPGPTLIATISSCSDLVKNLQSIDHKNDKSLVSLFCYRKDKLPLRNAFLFTSGDRFYMFNVSADNCMDVYRKVLLAFMSGLLDDPRNYTAVSLEFSNYAACNTCKIEFWRRSELFAKRSNIAYYCLSMEEFKITLSKIFDKETMEQWQFKHYSSVKDQLGRYEHAHQNYNNAKNHAESQHIKPSGETQSPTVTKTDSNNQSNQNQNRVSENANSAESVEPNNKESEPASKPAQKTKKSLSFINEYLK